jgi:predicted O-methyltransferase YrrM
MEWEEIRQIVQDVEGQLAYSEAELLYKLARQCTGKGVIVEVGSFQGKSTIFLGKGSLSGSETTVYAIDPHKGEMHKGIQDYSPTWDNFLSNIDQYGVKNIITPIRATSENAANSFNEPIELIFIDGLHDYQSVEKDFNMWFPKVIDGGIMAFHDTCNSHEGSRDVAYKYVYKSKQIKKAGLVNSITFGYKHKNSKLYSLNNYSLLLKNKLYEFEAKHPSLPHYLKQRISDYRKAQDRKTLDQF